MGYMIDNKEFDCAADASTTASGKLTLLNAAHPIFDGISRSTVEGTLDVSHTISLSMERIGGGLRIVGTWSNSAGTDFRVSGFSAPYIDTDLPAGHGRLDQIICLGFNLMNNDLFTNGHAGGTYTVSNFRLDYVVPPPFRITHTAFLPEIDGLTFTWDSREAEIYILELSHNLVDWQPVPNTTAIDSQGDSTTFELPFAEQNTYYRVRKQQP